jgi:phage terminase Nu1 subunit (DNA packaging protein)
LAGKKVSQSECALVFGVHRNTLSNWVKQGCPFDQKANKALGKDWILDTATVAQWREGLAVKNTVGDLTAVSEDELKRRKLAAETGTLELALAKLKGEVGLISEFEKTSQNMAIGISACMLLVPGRCSAQIAGMTDETEIKKIVDDEIRLALSESADIDLEDAE